MMRLLANTLNSISCAGIGIAAVVVAIAVAASGWLLLRRWLGKRRRISRPILPSIAKASTAKQQPAQRLPSDATILWQESHDLLISPLQMPSSALHGGTSGDPVLPSWGQHHHMLFTDLWSCCCCCFQVKLLESQALLLVGFQNAGGVVSSDTSCVMQLGRPCKGFAQGSLLSSKKGAAESSAAN